MKYIIHLFFVIISSLFIYINPKEPTFQEKLFLKICEENKDNNIMISPFSIYQVLAILSNGAGEEEQKEILEILVSKEEIDNDNEILDKINKNFEKIFSSLSDLNNEQLSTDTLSKQEGEDNPHNKKIQTIGEIVLHKKTQSEPTYNESLIFDNVNALFLHKSLSVEKTFEPTCEAYKTSIQELINVSQINEFVYNKTRGKIAEVIEKLDSNTAFILINVVYFKGYWIEPFNQNKTTKRLFENNDNSLVEVDTMYNTYKDIKYYEDDNIQMIELPYISRKLSFKMVIILPNKSKFSSSFEYMKTENINFNELISKMEITDNIVHLYLPKFEMDFNQELEEILKKMGMVNSFSCGALSKMFGNNAGNIGINKIIHQTYIKVDEEGSEAAAVTAVIGLFKGIDEPKTYYMHVNHSFIYTILSDDIKDHNGNYLIPFIGVINNLEGSIINYKSSDNDSNNKDNIKINDNEVTNNTNSNISNITNILNNSFINDTITTGANNSNNVFENDKSDINKINLLYIILIIMVFIN